MENKFDDDFQLPTKPKPRFPELEEDDEPTKNADSDDESFDEDDDDPDKIEVPGGGKTLMDSSASVDQAKVEAKPMPDMIPISSQPPGSFDLSTMKGGQLPGLLPQLQSVDQGMNNIIKQLLSNFQKYPGQEQAASVDPAQGVNPFLGNYANGRNPLHDYAMYLCSLPNVDFTNTHQPLPVQKPQTSRSIGELWGNSKHNLNPSQNPPEEDLELEVEEEDMGATETYADYKPAKSTIGKRHPDAVVETASLGSVTPPDITYDLHLPSKVISSGALSALQLEAVVYACQQHEHFLSSGHRAAFLIGDGAGVGKGRTIAGIIYENYLLGRKKSIWVSVSSDLKYDSERDLSDIGAAHINVHALNKQKYGAISSIKDGVIFSTYASLIGESNQSGAYNTRFKQLLKWCGKDFDGVIVFDECHRAKNLCAVGNAKPTKTGITVENIQNQLPKARIVYASATGASEPKNMAYMTRLGIWGDGAPFKNFGDFMRSIDRRGVGAMEIIAMDMKLRGTYIARQLSFKGVSFNIEKVALSENDISIYDESVVLWVEAMQRIIEACTLMVVEKPIRKNIWAQFWAAHQRFFKYLCIAAKVKHVVRIAREAMKDNKCVVIGLQSTGEAKTLDQLEREDGYLTDFVSTAKGVFQSLIEKHFPSPADESKTNALLERVRSGFTTSQMFESLVAEQKAEESAAGPSGLSSIASGRGKRNARKRIRLDSSLNSGSDSDDVDFQASDHTTSTEDLSEESASSPAITSPESDDELVGRGKGRNRKQAIKTRKALEKSHQEPKASKSAAEIALKMKKELLEKIEKLGSVLPPNTLDHLIDELGGSSEVAEMTGRKGRVVSDDTGKVLYESRSEADASLETINLLEKERFMSGEKLIAIISEAASSGISLQSDRRVKNQRRRVHITVELPWSADRAIQQFGRTHRSNQVNAPEYIFLISDLAGETRFASIVAKRLESLGALTQGDRRATDTRDLSQFHIDNKYGRSALETVLKSVIFERAPLLPPPKDYVGDFFADIAGALVGAGIAVNDEKFRGHVTIEKDFFSLSKFLNRILGMPVRHQNALFQYFTDTLAHIIDQAKRAGTFDLGILDVTHVGGGVEEVKVDTFHRKHSTGVGVIKMHKLFIERGMSWEDALEKQSYLTGKHEGFYLAKQARNEKRTAVLIISETQPGPSSEKKSARYSLYRPNTGLQSHQVLGEILNKYQKVTPDEAELEWIEQYINSETTCTHAYWNGKCKATIAGGYCEVGLRRRTYNILSGAVLLVWGIVEKVLADQHRSKIQIVRIRSDEVRLVGLLVPNNCVGSLLDELRFGIANDELVRHDDARREDADSDDRRNLLES